MYAEVYKDLCTDRVVTGILREAELQVRLDRVKSLILQLVRALAGEKLSGKTHDVGVGGEKQARKTKPEANLANIWKSGLKSYP